jgi:Flp pilus assembly protein TadG
MTTLSNSMKRLLCERGQSTIFVALSLLVLLAFLGLAIDVGLLFHARRTMQTAADAAAITGAAEWPGDSTPYTLVKSYAKAAAAANGYTDGSNGVTITVYPPAATGPYAGKAGSVEVIVSQARRTFFMALMGFTTMPVNARAVAIKGGNAPSMSCLTVLNPSAAQALELQGKFDLSAPACGVAVNSKNADAIDVTGNAGTLTAKYVGVAGGCQSNPTTACSTNIQPAPVQSAPTSDPLYFLPDIPDSPSGCAAVPKSGVLTPGSCYSGNPTINGTLSAGTYTFTGNVTLGTVTANGVALLLSKNATLNVDVGTLTMSPPTSGTYEGVSIYASRDNTNQIKIQKGSSNGTISGIIYAPSAQLYLQDNGGGVTLNSDLVVNSLFDKASTLTINSYTQANPSTSPLTRVALVE